MDPACGGGAFLAYALEHNITSPDRLFGIEKDPEVAATWVRTGLKDRANMFVADGLCPANRPIPPSPPLPIAFDWVVGNPPFGTRNLKSDPDFEETIRAVQQSFTIWRRDGRRSPDFASYPVEVLFLERFWQLAKPGGYVGIIIPDGILANARLSYVREWLSDRASVRVVVSLPQHTFSAGGASAKASLLIFQRKPVPAGRIFTADLESPAPVKGGVKHLVALFADLVSAERDSPHPNPLPPAGEGGSPASDSAFPIPHSAVDCPPWGVYLMEPQEPGGRLDPAYYHPKYSENLRALRNLPNVVEFGELIEFTTYGQVGTRVFARSGVRLLTPANLKTTDGGLVIGVDVYRPERFVAPGSRNDPARSRLRRGDLLLSNSGVGCIGRPAVFLSDEVCNISQHINLIRVKGVQPEYIAVYLQTRFARLQIEREKCGVGPSGINFDRIKSLLIPILQADIRESAAREYLRLTRMPM